MSNYFFNGAMKIATITIPKRKSNANAGPTQNGDNTHHQDQSILSVSFNPMNKRPKRDKNDTLDFACVLFSLAILIQSFENNKANITPVIAPRQAGIQFAII